ncbi:MAG: DNA/RNA nuclease SfsA [Chthonomonadales bacterium]
MRFPFHNQAATFMERPNRFLVRVSLMPGGEAVYAHCPDPGRLAELLLPGATVYVSRDSGQSVRTTEYTLRFVEHPSEGILVSVVSRLANDLFREALAEGVFPSLAAYTRVRAEVPLPPMEDQRMRSRADFRLEGDGLCPCWLEVKSATLVVNGSAYFPDAVTERGRRHLSHLRRMAAGGERCAVCFVVQRPDAHVLRPQWDRDPAFAREMLLALQAGVEFYACTTLITPAEARVMKEIPVRPEAPTHLRAGG